MKKKALRMIMTAAAVLVAATASAFSVDTVDVSSKYLDRPMRVTVYTPEAAKQVKKLPTVYLLNGFGGDYRAWPNVRPDLGEYADHYGMVIVCPSGMNSWYWNSPENPGMQMESFFVETLVPYIRKHFPSSPEARLNAITGLSMGGHGALWLGTRHPNIWHNLGSTSGGVNILPFPERWKMAEQLGPYKDKTERWEQHTVINLVPQMAENKQNIIFDCGTNDVFTKVNAELHQKLLDAKVDHDYISRPGQHNRTYWNNSILYQLLFFHENFKKSGEKF